METNKICAIICEYNPFHNGHKLLIDEAKKLSGCEYIACIMSGDFSQRGEACILNKYNRAQLALCGGADIVIHMPTAYASSSAEVFARCGINIASSLKNVTHICFGSECGDIELLSNIADFFIKEPKEYKLALKSYLDQGNSFAISKSMAIKNMAEKDIVSADFVSTLNGSNNILAIEYIKALKLTKSPLIPLTIARKGEEFNSKKENTFASATSIRETIYKKGIKTVQDSVPKDIFPLFKDMIEKQGLPSLQTFDLLRLGFLRTMSLDNMQKIFDVGEGIENRLYASARENINYNNFLTSSITKRYSESKINRIVLASILGITQDITKKVYTTPLPYIKVLAVKRNKILSHLDCKVPLVIRNSDIPKLNAYAYDLIEIENKADGIYSLITNKVNTLPYIRNQALVINM